MRRAAFKGEGPSSQVHAGKGPTRVLVLIKGFQLGGAERFLVDGLPYLDRERFSYEFAYVLPWLSFLVPQIQRRGFPVHCLGQSAKEADNHWVGAGNRLDEIARIPSALRELSGLRKQGQFDLIHAHLPLTGVMARVVGRWHGVPVVYHEQNLPERGHLLTRQANYLTYGWNRCVCAVSREVIASIERLGLRHKTRIELVLNAISIEQVREEAKGSKDLRQELGIGPEALVVGTVAVFSRQKRLDDWLEVAARIAAEREDVVFLLAGDGPDALRLRAQVAALGLGDRAKLPGFRPDGRRALAAVDIYLMTSEYEGLPLAMLEAMALGKPVVATAVGGIPEVVREGQEGFLAPVGAVDELARQAVRLLDDGHLRREMGQRGARKIEREYHIEQRVRFLEDLYLDLLGEGP